MVKFDSRSIGRNLTVNNFNSKRTRQQLSGCLTCKVRKKKCNEQRPVCSDCNRLNKECIWIDGKSRAQVKKLRMQVEEIEKDLKLRHRVKKTADSPTSLSQSPLPPLTGKGLESFSQDTEVMVISPTKILDSLELANSPPSIFQTPPPFDTFSGRDSNIDFLSFNSMLSNIPLSPSILPEVSLKGSFLYEYYVDTLSHKLSIAPSSQNESNSYRSVFLPLAHRDKGVFYSILAWAGFHLGGKWAEEARRYTQLALEHLQHSFLKGNEIDREKVLIKLATLLILCGAEIYGGDIKNWSVYLYWGWETLVASGGINNYCKTREEHWLASNFAYHDLLASSCCERGTYFPTEDYDFIFKDPQGVSRGFVSPVLGVSKKLFKLLGDINTLASMVRDFYDTYKDLNNDPTESPALQSPILILLKMDPSRDAAASARLSTMLEKALVIEREIEMAKPDPMDLEKLTHDELELQLTLFDAFQSSAQLFLRQTVFRENPSSLRSQILVTDVIKCIEIMIGTPVQASLVFPFFICGVHCITPYHRKKIFDMSDKLTKLYGAYSIKRVKSVIEKVWEVDPNGNTAVDWHSILKELDWDINFA